MTTPRLTDWLPRFERGGWSSQDFDGEHAVEGRWFAIQWLGVVIEINFGRVR